MTKLSAVVITLNEEAALGRCLESLRLVADEIVVVDSGSTDRTAAIGTAMGARVIVHPFENYVAQKNLATGLAGHDHVLSLDADEVLSDRLARSVASVKQRWDCDGYRLARLTNYCGTWIRHTDWYPDCRIRLWDRRAGSWEGVYLHEDVRMRPGATTRTLAGDLLHYSYDSIGQHVQRMNRYTDLMAEEAYAAGIRPSAVHFIVNPVWKFIKSYFLRAGVLDGYHGFVIAGLSAFATYVKYVKLGQKWRRGSTGKARNAAD